MTTTPPVVFTEDQVRGAVDMDMAITSARHAFTLTASEGVSNPTPWHLDMPDGDGEVHVKGAAARGEPTFAIKMSTGFPANADIGEPTCHPRTGKVSLTTVTAASGPARRRRAASWPVVVTTPVASPIVVSTSGARTCTCWLIPWPVACATADRFR
jgi:hypothetical protein